MSEITTDLVWYPPEFPVQGRLPSQAALVGKNCNQQESLERAYRDEFFALNPNIRPILQGDLPAGYFMLH